MKPNSFLTIVVLVVALMLGATATPAAAQTALSAWTMTAPADGIAFTIGAHTNVWKSPSGIFYNGEAVVKYTRTLTAAWSDTLYIPGADSSKTGIDSSCVVSIERESGSWLKPGGATFTLNQPTVTFLANPRMRGAKRNWVILSYPAADTLTAKLRFKKPQIK